MFIERKMTPNFHIYKSSAGSGKTTALIKIFLTLSLRNDNPSQFKKILAITFTNKAAAEMKERLIHELNTMSQLDDSYTGDNFMVNELLKETQTTIEKLSQRASAMFKVVLHDFNDLSIGTIDQFNHRLIRSFSRELHLKSDFEVELKEKELFREAVNRLIEKVGRDEFITNHLMHYVQYKLDEERKANISRDLMDLHALVLGENGMEALEALEKMDRSDFESIRKQLLQTMQKAKEVIQNHGLQALKCIDSAGLTPLDFSGKGSGVGAFFEKIAEFPHPKLNLNSSYISKALDGNWVSKTAPNHVKAAVESIESELNAILVNTLDAYGEQAPEYYRASAIFQHIDLIAILEELNERIDEICEERNILPISKFNKIISNALRKEPVAFLYEHYGMRFNHILIDEYQDTSELQWFNILPLIDESLAKGYSSLVVGDAKQSIYRWRGGKAEQLIALPQLIDAPADLKMSVASTLERNAGIVELNTNYRSKPNIVEFNNALFSQLGLLVNAPDSLYQSEYKEEKVSQKLKDSKNQRGFVQVDYLGKNPEPEARCDKLIQGIQAFKALGYAYRDMAVLVRSTTKDGRLFLSAMQEAEIPVSTADSFEVDKDEHVQLILAILRLVVNHEDPAAIISVMRSFETIYNIPFEPEKYIKGEAKKRNNSLSIDSFLSKNQFPDLGLIENSKGVFDCTQAVISAYLPGVNSRFLNGLLDIILSRIGMNASVFHFFTWWDNLNEKPSVPDRSGSDAVQLMTIHKSKGLQFKIVFVPNLNWKKRSVNNELAWFDLKKFSNSPLPYAPFTLNSGLDNMNLSEEWAEEESANDFDNLNLIYVALTRAVDALCISYEYKTSGHVGTWIHAAMDELANNKLKDISEFEITGNLAENFTITIGKPIENTSDDSEEISKGDIEWVEPNNMPWTDNVQLAPILRNRDQIRGIWFHRIVSLSTTENEIDMQLEKLEKSGVLNKSEITELGEMLKTLYLDTKFVNLRRESKIIAERDLFFEGDILRPDLVFESENKMVVIDFKTGVQKPEHSHQVKRYALALKTISDKPTDAYLLYTNDMKWEKIEQTQNVQGRLF